MIRVIAYGIVFGFIVTIASGCSTDVTSGNQNLTKENIAKITKGVTTRAQIEQMLGPADMVAMLPDGGRRLTYIGSQSKIGYGAEAVEIIPFMPGHDSSTRRQQTLAITLNSKDVVTDYEFDDTATETDRSTSVFGASIQTKAIPTDSSTTGPSN